jgi:hypothetical protein
VVSRPAETSILRYCSSEPFLTKKAKKVAFQPEPFLPGRFDARPGRNLVVGYWRTASNESAL